MLPDFQSMMLPLLQSMADGNPCDMSRLRAVAISFFSVSEDEQNKRTPSGAQTLLYNRTAWAVSYLKSAGLVVSPEHGRYKITAAGIELLKNPPERITIRLLNKIKDGDTSADGPDNPSTPDEQIEDGVQKFNQELADEILLRLDGVSPAKFEQIVVDLLVKMGYGIGGHVTQLSCDEGIDGIIQEDCLGLDKIYVQAKRWKKESKVGRPDIQKFMGALVGKGAKKGIFLTTASFSSEAVEYANDSVVASIALVDGRALADLMIRFGAGVSVKSDIRLCKIDTDFFLDD